MSKDYKKLVDVIARQIVERIRERATIQGRIPFLTGDLRKSLVATDAIQRTAIGEFTLTSPLVYARAVHDGRPRITFGPRNKKMLAWPARSKGKRGARYIFAKEVTQEARKGKPFIREAIDEIGREGFDFLRPTIMQHLEKDLAENIPKEIRFDLNL